MRQSPTLSDQEKIGYTEALKAISMLPPNAPPSAVDDVYSRHGLDPAKFGGSGGMPAKWPSAPGAGAAQPQARTGGVGLRAQSSFEPQTRDEYLLTQQALLDGYTPVSRGNAMFGAGELLFEDQNGNRRWASQLGMK